MNNQIRHAGKDREIFDLRAQANRLIRSRDEWQETARINSINARDWQVKYDAALIEVERVKAIGADLIEAARLERVRADAAERKCDDLLRTLQENILQGSRRG